MSKLTRVKLPHTYALIFSFVVLAAVLTWVIPGGQYERTTNAQGREVVVDGTFGYVEGQPQGLLAVLKSPLTGIVETANIIAFILIIGGVFAVIQKTRAIDATILRVAQKLKNRGIVIIPIGMVLFSIFGAVFGMSEEVIPFVLVFIPLALALGYDSIVGVAIPFLGAGLGFAGAMFNPFTLGIAQGIAELPLFSGMVYRLIVWAVVTTIGTLIVMRYAVKIHKDPESSPVSDLDQARKGVDTESPDIVFNTRHRLILLVFTIGFVLMVFGVMKYQ